MALGEERAPAKRSSTPTKAELEASLEQAAEDLREKEARLADLTDRLSYLQAELENLRKAAEKERREVLRRATERLMLELLPVVDEFDLALKTMKGRDDDVGSGVRMIREHLLRVLQREGLEEIPADGEEFDPYVHEAVAYTPDGARDGVVVEVLLKGYRTQDRILRPSQVVVCRKEGEEDG